MNFKHFSGTQHPEMHHQWDIWHGAKNLAEKITSVRIKYVINPFMAKLAESARLGLAAIPAESARV